MFQMMEKRPLYCPTCGHEQIILVIDAPLTDGMLVSFYKCKSCEKSISPAALLRQAGAVFTFEEKKA